MEKKRRIWLSGMLAAVVLAGCGNGMDDEVPVLTTAVSQIRTDIDEQSRQLRDYDSPYTICYQNKDDTYSLYIFASPIQYKTNAGYALIDNTVIPSGKEGFAWENKANEVKTYFPKTLADPFRVEKGTDFLEFRPDVDADEFSEAKQEIFENMYGDRVSAVVYRGEEKELVFYPTKAGIKTELVLKEKTAENTLEFIVHTNAESCEDKQNGYVLFQKGGENSSIIYGPLVRYTGADGEQQLDITTKMETKREEGDPIVSLSLGEEILSSAAAETPVRLDSSFEMYLNKMPDSTVYENHNINNYLANYAVVGHHPNFGQGWHYSRFNLHKVFEGAEKSIIFAAFHIKSFNDSPSSGEIRAFTPCAQWQSSRILWGTKIESGADIVSSSSKKTNQGYYEFDMTDFTNQCLMDDSWLKEDIGLVFKLTGADHLCIATSDNALYPPYMRIDLLTLPKDFFPRDDYFN